MFLDAEHFFDAYHEDNQYSLAVLSCAAEAGADALILCETNGGRLPHEVAEITGIAAKHLPDAVIGIHTHNDAGCAVANVLSAVCAGASQVQGTNEWIRRTMWQC